MVPIQRKQDTVHALKCFIAEQRVPREVLYNDRTKYQGAFKELCIEKGICWRHCTPYSAFMMGLVERHNREVKS